MKAQPATHTASSRESSREWKVKQRGNHKEKIAPLYSYPHCIGDQNLKARTVQLPETFFFNQIEASTEAWMVGFSQGEAKQLLGRKYSK